MRRVLLMISVLLSFAPAAPASALEADDSMQAWKHASEAERSALLKKLGFEGANVARCVDEASAIPGHSELPISEVAKACASQADQPV